MRRASKCLGHLISVSSAPKEWVLQEIASWAGSKLICDTRKPEASSDAPAPRGQSGTRRSQAGWHAVSSGTG